MHSNRNSVAIGLVSVCSFVLFALMGFVVSGLPIAYHIYAPSTFTVIHLAVFSATVGILAGVVVIEGRWFLTKMLILAFFATVGFVVGLGYVMPYTLPILVFCGFALGQSFVLVSFNIMAAVEARRAKET